MKKQLLCVLLMVLILPLSSFNGTSVRTLKMNKISLKSADDGFIGYFYVYGHEYTAVGDYPGGTSGNVTALYEDGIAVSLVGPSNTWSYSYGVPHNGLGVSVSFIRLNGQSGSYQGLTAL